MKRLADQTLYEILEVPPDASPEQIEAAYEKARALYGPGSIVTYTLIEPDEAALLEARIEDARGTLLDPERRARYDASLQERAESRAAAGGSAAPSGGAPPPVIPALQPAPPGDAPPAPAGSAAPAEPEPVSAPVPATPPLPPIPLVPVEEAAPAAAPPAPGPILLDREVPPAPPPPAEPRAPAAAPAAPAAPAAAAAADAPAEHAPAPSAPGPVVPPPIPDAWTGEALRQVREARGISIQAISERTKVTRHHIENIEGDRFAFLPAQVYLRGILLALARELRLDGQKVARSYLERIGGGAAPSASPTKPR